MSNQKKTYSEPRRELYVSRESNRFKRDSERKQARKVKSWERSAN